MKESDHDLEEDTVSEVSFLKMRIEQIDKCRN